MIYNGEYVELIVPKIKFYQIKDITGLNKYINEYVRCVKKFNKALAGFGLSVLDKQTESRFEVGGIETGTTPIINERWKPLSLYTIRKRMKKFGETLEENTRSGQWMGDGLIDNQPILRLTGRGRKSIGKIALFRTPEGNMELVYGVRGMPRAYMGEHQEGSGRIPARPFLGISAYIAKTISKFIDTWAKKVFT